MLVFYVKKPFLLKKAFFPKKNDPKMPFFQKKNFGPKNFFRPKMPKKPNFSIKKMFFGGSKRVLGVKIAENSRKMAKNHFWTKNFFGHFWTILDLFGTKNRFFHPKNLFLSKISILSKKNFWLKNFDFLQF